MTDSLIGRSELVGLAISAVENSPGVLFIGPAGVGKSALAEAVATALEDRGAVVESLRCSPMTSAIPFAPLMHIRAPEAGQDPGHSSRALIDAIIERAAGRRLVLSVDDLAHADAGTATVIFGLLLHHQATVLASCRTEETNAAAVHSLWKDGMVTRIDVEPLDIAAIGDLITTITETRPTEALRSSLARRGAGNPLFTLALARVGMSSGAIQDVDGRATLVRDLPPSSEIEDLVRAQIAGLSAGDHEMLETIGVGENMPLETFGDIETQRRIERLVSDGLVVIDRRSPYLATRCAHPLIGEFVRSSTPPGRSRAIQAGLVTAVAANPLASPLDLLRASKLAVQSGCPAPVPLLMGGAEVALRVFEFEHAAAVAQRLLDEAPAELAPTAHLLLGTALANMGATDRAHHHLDLADADGAPSMNIALAAVARSIMVTFAEADPVRAEQVLRDAFDRLPSGNERSMVASALVWPLAVLARWEEARSLMTEAAGAPDVAPATRLAALGNLSMAKFMLADVDGLDRVIADGLALTNEAGAHSSLSHLQLRTAQLVSTHMRGDLRAAIDGCRDITDLYVVSGVTGGVYGAVSSLLGLVQAMTGDLDDARLHAAVAVEETNRFDIIGTAPMVRASLARTQAQAGDVAGAIDTLNGLPYEVMTADDRYRFFTGWAEAWIAAATDPKAGAEKAHDVAATAWSKQMRYWGLCAMFTPVRFGHPDLVDIALLDAQATRSGCKLFRLFHDHAVAAATANADALTQCAVRWTSAGAWAVAAEAHAIAAQAEADDAASARHMLAASVAHAQCSGATSPVLATISSPLSEPELDVARRAAAGASSKQIAEARFVSSRTVDNQLRSVYRKLGLGGRSELADIVLLSSDHPGPDRPL